MLFQSNAEWDRHSGSGAYGQQIMALPSQIWYWCIRIDDPVDDQSHHEEVIDSEEDDKDKN